MRTIVVGLLLVAGPASAGPIAVTFAGQIVEVRDPSGGVFTAGMQPGVRFTASVVYDPDTAPSLQGSIVSYRWSSTSLTVGTRAFPIATPSPPFISSEDILLLEDYVDEMPSPDPGGAIDALHVMARLSQSQYTQGSFFHIALVDDTGTAFSGPGLPTRLDLDQFQRATFGLTLRPRGEEQSRPASVYGDVTAISVTAVPEPGSLVLLASAGLLMAAGRRAATRR